MVCRLASGDEGVPIADAIKSVFWHVPADPLDHAAALTQSGLAVLFEW